MPTNFKSFVYRSRSRNDLKLKEEGADSPAAPCDDNYSQNGEPCDPATVTCDAANTYEDFSYPRQFGSDGKFCLDSNTASCSSFVPSSHNCGSSHTQPSLLTSLECNSTNPKSPLVRDTNDTSNPGRAMRKCETVLTLSSLAGTHCSVSAKKGGSSGVVTSQSTVGVSEKAKVMKNKILSTSSSTLNCLLHSSGRSKLFSGWKLSATSSTNPSSSPEYPDISVHNVVSNEKATNLNESFEGKQVFKSQLSIPDNGFLPAPMTPLNRLRRNVSVNNAPQTCGYNLSFSRSSSAASFCWKESEERSPYTMVCRLCLNNVKLSDTIQMVCSCRYCRDCIVEYVSFEIQEGAEEISCPDATCASNGVFSLDEIERLVIPSLFEKHKKFRMYREVEKDAQLMWCPTPGCETVCKIEELLYNAVDTSKSHKSRGTVSSKSLTIHCKTCRQKYCAECKLKSHYGSTCEAYRKKLIRLGKLSVDDDELLFSMDSIKKCPFCRVPIEKDSGCAQMMCKKCKHVFCWYCLTSLDDDFLLRHYDKGPCKNKLGHSRASVIWHRAQVIGIFAGFSVLVLLASPLLILAAPCLLCCRCRLFSNYADANKDPEESPVPI